MIFGLDKYITPAISFVSFISGSIVSAISTIGIYNNIIIPDKETIAANHASEMMKEHITAEINLSAEKAINNQRESLHKIYSVAMNKYQHDLAKSRSELFAAKLAKEKMDKEYALILKKNGKSCPISHDDINYIIGVRNDLPKN
jgi:hypothetical protein